MNDVERATKALEQSIKYCVEFGPTHFKTATGGFPKSIIGMDFPWFHEQCPPSESRYDTRPRAVGFARSLRR